MNDLLNPMHPELARALVTQKFEEAHKVAMQAKAEGLPAPSLDETLDDYKQRLRREREQRVQWWLQSVLSDQ